MNWLMRNDWEILCVIVLFCFFPYSTSLSSKKFILSSTKSLSSSSVIPIASTLTSASASTSSATIGYTIANAKTWTDVLESSSLLILPGEETFPHHYQEHHQRKRQLYGLSSLKKLVQFLIGTSNYQKQQQLLMNNDDRYYRIVKAATTLTNNNNNNDNNNNNNNKIKDINDFYTSCDVIKEIVSITDFSNINGTNRERILNDLSEFIDKLLNFVSIRIKDINPIYIDRLDWALTRLYNYTNESRIKDYLEKINSKRQSFKLPFSVLQNIVSNSTTFEKLLNEVPFQAEKLFTRDGKSVQERRETCWMAEKGIDGLAYSGKIMIPVPFCESVKSVRDAVEQKTGHFFDCCLINYYPDGDSACKFHSDPDMGTLWAKETVVVSFGETRRFHFRSIGDKTENDQLHFTYRLFQGDIVYMFEKCQDEYQHAVMKGENSNNSNGRISIVFKKSIPMIGGKRGHGIPKGSTLGQKESQKSKPSKKSFDKKKK